MNTEEYHGKRNLILLGAGALAITLITTCLSLWVYRTSGDIFLDRSRPGYLPDKDEASEETEVGGTYVFDENGPLSTEDLTEYLKELKTIINRLNALDDPYAPGVLSDESLGIKTSKPEETAK